MNPWFCKHNMAREDGPDHWDRCVVPGEFIRHLVGWLEPRPEESPYMCTLTAAAAEHTAGVPAVSLPGRQRTRRRVEEWKSTFWALRVRRAFISEEFGKLRGRIHYHAVVLTGGGEPESVARRLAAGWSEGRTLIEVARRREEAVEYVTKYAASDVFEMAEDGRAGTPSPGWFEKFDVAKAVRPDGGPLQRAPRAVIGMAWMRFTKSGLIVTCSRCPVVWTSWEDRVICRSLAVGSVGVAPLGLRPTEERGQSMRRVASVAAEDAGGGMTMGADRLEYHGPRRGTGINRELARKFELRRKRVLKLGEFVECEAA